MGAAHRRTGEPSASHLEGATHFGRAQDGAELTLRMSRTFGYSSGTGKVQGTFTLKGSGPENLESVLFFVDGELMGEVSEAPFHYRFVTDDYPLGLHTLSAIGTTTDGRELRSNEIQAEFVTAEEGWGAAMKIMVPMGGIVLIAIVLSFAVTFISARRVKDIPLGASREYGFAGGAICPRCNRPYNRHVLAPNMLFGKLERCPFCGKWAIVPAASMEALRAAEKAELQGEDGEVVGQSEEERLRISLEDSRYQDL